MIKTASERSVGQHIRDTEVLVQSEGWLLFCAMAEEYKQSLLAQMETCESGEKAMKLAGMVTAVRHLTTKPERWLKSVKTAE